MIIRSLVEEHIIGRNNNLLLPQHLQQLPVSQLASGAVVVIHGIPAYGILLCALGFALRSTFVTRRQQNKRLSIDNVIISLRGGDGDVAIDLDRVGLRLDSLEEYCVLASIFLAAVIDIYGDKPEKPDHPLEQIAYGIHGVSVCIGFLAAVYTTVVFALFCLYSKYALGTGDDMGYLGLLGATGWIRIRGFHSFMLCLFCFHISFLMNLVLNYVGATRWVILSIAVAGTLFCLNQFQFIIDTANRVIFKKL